MKNNIGENNCVNTSRGPDESDGMSNYIGTKRIKAIPMDSITFKKERGITCEGEENQEGYKVVYPDGYISWSPKRTFEKAYVKTYFSPFSEGKTFGEALEWVRSGKHSMRLPHWNKGVKIKMHPPILEAPSYEMNDYFLCREYNSECDYGIIPFIPTQKELLSGEWIVD